MRCHIKDCKIIACSRLSGKDSRKGHVVEVPFILVSGLVCPCKRLGNKNSDSALADGFLGRLPVEKTSPPIGSRNQPDLHQRPARHGELLANNPSTISDSPLSTLDINAANNTYQGAISRAAEHTAYIIDRPLNNNVVCESRC